jgi:NAD(P)-dependent dehydrogenase (short-subunit alcohol dehydrogenase family)
MLLGLRDVNARGDLVAQIAAMGRTVVPLQMDMRCLDQIFRAIDDTVTHFGRLDTLVNNAGLAPGNLAENVREEDFDLTVGVNLKGTFFASQAAGRVMIQQKGGRISRARCNQVAQSNSWPCLLRANLANSSPLLQPTCFSSRFTSGGRCS